LTTFNRSFNGTLSISSTSASERKGVFNRCASAVSGTRKFLEIGTNVAEGLITSFLLDDSIAWDVRRLGPFSSGAASSASLAVVVGVQPVNPGLRDS
jgi:hypothetical protein